MAQNILLTIFIAGFFTFGAGCYGLYLIFTRNAKARADVDAKNALAKTQIESLEWAQNEVLYAGKGREGEKRVAQAVEHIMGSLNVTWATNENMGLPNAILLPDDKDPFSKEFDLVLLCDLGLFVFEVKDWHGTWRESTDFGYIETTRENGAVERRTAPLLKTQRKFAALKRKLGCEIDGEALVVFTDDASSLSAKLPAQYMHVSELGYYFRAKRDTTKNVTNVWKLRHAVKECFDQDKNALHNHMLRLTPSNEMIKGYQARNRALTSLKQRPDLTYPEPGKYGMWVKVMIAGMAVVFISYEFGQIAYFG